MAKGHELPRDRQILRKIVAFIGSKHFFVGVLVLLALQASWYAFSFQPSINDESQHLGNIYFYSEHLSPFVGQQDTSWDHLGEIPRNGSYMFYYLMSWPLRILRAFTDNSAAQIIVLRLLNILFVVVGVVYYRKALRLVKRLPDSVLNLVFLLFVLTPSVALLPGAVNYDNLAFLMFAYLFYLSIKQVKKRTLDIKIIAAIAALSLFTAVVKWTAIALILPLVGFLAVDLYKKHGKHILKDAWSQIQKLPRPQVIAIALGLLVAGALFMERPVLNVLRYGNPNPKCQQVLGDERCQSYPNYYIYKSVLENKPANFVADDPPRYLLNLWAPKMISTATNQLERTSTQLPVAVALFTLLAAIAVGSIILCLRELLTDKYFVFILLIVTVYLGFLLLDEYGAYSKYGIPAAIRARYLIPILPLIGYLSVAAIYKMFGRYRRTLLVCAVAVVLAMTQGGSIVTYALTTPQHLYWPNSFELSLNNHLKKLLAPLVNE